jgi:hypothetical protein
MPFGADGNQSGRGKLWSSFAVGAAHVESGSGISIQKAGFCCIFFPVAYFLKGSAFGAEIPLWKLNKGKSVFGSLCPRVHRGPESIYTKRPRQARLLNNMKVFIIPEISGSNHQSLPGKFNDAADSVLIDELIAADGKGVPV